MIELIVGTYGFLCWLLFKKLKLIPTNTYTVSTALIIGVILIAGILLLLGFNHPVTHDARLYAYTIPIVSQVRGLVVEVPVQPNVPLAKGDVLFRIDPQPYQFEVERLEAALADANSDVGQLEQRHSAAEAATRQAESDLLASESELDRQAREAVEQADAVVKQARTAVDFATGERDRYKEQLDSGIISRQTFDVVQQRLDTAQAQLEQAQAAQRQAAEKLAAGGDRMKSAQERVNQARAQEQELRLAMEADSGGYNPQVRQILADLENKRWELEQCVTRAPSAGYATQVVLQPGQMATPFAARPVMVFVSARNLELIATYPQNVIKNIEPDLEAEVAFKALPSKIFKTKVVRTIPIIAEAQILAGAELASAKSEKAGTKIPVVFEYTAEMAAHNLPAGAIATAAVYTHHLHALSIVRKILLRIKSWENYLLLPSFGGGH